MSQSLTQFAQEVGRSRDTVNRAIVTLGLTIPKPQPGKPTPLSPAVQDALRTYFGAYPQLPPEPPPAEPRLMPALERIYKVNLEAHQRTQAQVNGLQTQVGSLKAELETFTDRLTELQALLAESRQITPPEMPRRSPLTPIAIVTALLMAGALWLSQQSPSLQTDRLSDPSRAELYQ
jgi:hypothetical protein